MFTGPYCEDRIESSGSGSMFLFIFLVALVIAGIVLLRQRDKFDFDANRLIRQQQAVSPRANAANFAAQAQNAGSFPIDDQRNG